MMKYFTTPAVIVFFSLVMTISIWGCAQTKSKTGNPTLVDAVAFSQLINEHPDAVLLDVRTPGEFESGHLKNAVNVDWNGADFAKNTALLDKSKPVYVYCKSGGRSAAAAEKLRSDGFSQVVELKGGIMQWEAASLPVEGAKPHNGGLTLTEFNAQTSSGTVLVNFYAEWCIPCRKMNPYLTELEQAYAGKIQFLRLDVDANKALMQALQISGVPVLQLYKNGSLSWNHMGFIEKADLEKQLNP